MKKALRTLGIVLLIVIAIAVWMYFDLKNATFPIYIPGRDTLKEWNDGECEIVGDSHLNELRFLNQGISEIGSIVKAYKKVDNLIYFIMTEGEIVVDLDAKTYETYEPGESIDEKYRVEFDEPDSFVWLSTND